MHVLCNMLPVSICSISMKMLSCYLLNLEVEEREIVHSLLLVLLEFIFQVLICLNVPLGHLVMDRVAL